MKPTLEQLACIVQTPYGELVALLRAAGIDLAKAGIDDAQQLVREAESAARERARRRRFRFEPQSTPRIFTEMSQNDGR